MSNIRIPAIRLITENTGQFWAKTIRIIVPVGRNYCLLLNNNSRAGSCRAGWKISCAVWTLLNSAINTTTPAVRKRGWNKFNFEEPAIFQRLNVRFAGTFHGWTYNIGILGHPLVTFFAAANNITAVNFFIRICYLCLRDFLKTNYKSPFNYKMVSYFIESHFGIKRADRLDIYVCAC